MFALFQKSLSLFAVLIQSDFLFLISAQLSILSLESVPKYVAELFLGTGVPSANSTVGGGREGRWIVSNSHVFLFNCSP